MIVISPHDVLMVTHHDVRHRHISEHERIARELRRARRYQRWADLFRRSADRMSRMARLRLARLP